LPAVRWVNRQRGTGPVSLLKMAGQVVLVAKGRLRADPDPHWEAPGPTCEIKTAPRNRRRPPRTGAKSFNPLPMELPRFKLAHQRCWEAGTTVTGHINLNIAAPAPSGRQPVPCRFSGTADLSSRNSTLKRRPGERVNVDCLVCSWFWAAGPSRGRGKNRAEEER